MRKIYFLFAIVAICLIRIHENVAEEFDLDKYDSGDTKLVEYEDSDDYVPEKPRKRDRIRSIKNFVGTNLFGDTGCRKKCFSVEDIALLAARRDFESLVPKDLPDCLLDDELVKLLLQYFYCANQIIEQMSGGQGQILAQRAFYDTMGGYLKYYVMPITRYSFYAGLVKLKTVENVINLYDQCKEALNTNGNGWKAPIDDFTDVEVQIEPLRIVVHSDEEESACIQLDLGDEHSGEEEDMIVSLPRLETEDQGMLGNIWLPFKRKHTFDLQSSKSAFLLLRYFELTTKCYHFEEVPQDSFNRKLKEWILENLEVHLADDLFYPGLGAILRIMETLRLKNNCIVVDMPNKPKSKRFKTKNYKLLENKAKQMAKQPEFLLRGRQSDDIFNSEFQMPYRDPGDRGTCDENRRLVYILIVIIICVLLLIFTLGFALMLRQVRKRSSGRRRQHPSSPPPPTPPPPPMLKPKRSIMKNMHLCMPRDDEELLLGPESSSIASTSKARMPPPPAEPMKHKRSKEAMPKQKSKESVKEAEEEREEEEEVEVEEPKKQEGKKHKEEKKKEEMEPVKESEEEPEEAPKKGRMKQRESSSRSSSSTSSTPSSSPPESPKCFTLCNKKSPNKSGSGDVRKTTDDKKKGIMRKDG